ncbi:hypothetical protein TNIN_41831 [Trichonephila inaurata madagascariensis]|uniref:Uncharacterized protein n=1 Tax=Trichonephila inaurata madagascariensis TaxID=2747483 RepID=A0A8X7BQ03_9ARAC|nr:hypothetical protein TNIN_236661 [Trichonephila inaurata madagascariensis]GFY73868.1 hypothetical protein TNIN_41831 [Trichonephila inaurata madagascariensis]
MERNNVRKAVQLLLAFRYMLEKKHRSKKGNKTGNAVFGKMLKDVLGEVLWTSYDRNIMNPYIFGRCGRCWFTGWFRRVVGFVYGSFIFISKV